MEEITLLHNIFQTLIGVTLAEYCILMFVGVIKSNFFEKRLYDKYDISFFEKFMEKYRKLFVLYILSYIYIPLIVLLLPFYITTHFNNIIIMKIGLIISALTLIVTPICVYKHMKLSLIREILKKKQEVEEKVI